MPWLILLAVVVVIAFYFMTTYNGFISWRNRVDEAFSTMDVYMVKRYDLIPNLVETVKGYAKHEQETLEQVISARNNAVSANTMDEKMKAEGEVAGVLGRLFALSESYPDLKANEQFLDLQGQLQKVEEDIAQSRKYYNGSVRQYNTNIQRFPANFVANMFGFGPRQSFEVDDPTQRESVKVQF
ncbi:MAG: LemA family protein [Erysipelothrix sp.]|jgi:LemA protein|nr:LemA family protein [Erysipelothrix sp.]